MKWEAPALEQLRYDSVSCKTGVDAGDDCRTGSKAVIGCKNGVEVFSSGDQES